MTELRDLLPELGRIFTYDLEKSKDFWFSQFDSFMDWTEAFWHLLYIMSLGGIEAEKEAIKVIEEFVQSRQKPYGQWKSSGWLAFMLRQIKDKTQNSPKTEKALTDDELPF
jgi:hypothetical protein